MNAGTMGAAERTRSARFKALARRCRELSEITAVPEITRELSNIADELENEAENLWEGER